MPTQEFNFDGIVGPTHNYAGLSFGNVASSSHRDMKSSPRMAALQGLEKMKFVASLGIGQCVLPPLKRPNLEFLRGLGFSGSDGQVIDKAYQTAPRLLAACYSASNMWTANAATISPATDTADQRLHLSPANLSSTLHRSIEHPATTRVLRAIFADEQNFVVHDPLPATPAFADEGAANHTRLTNGHGEKGLEMFVYGREAMNRDGVAPKKYPARQTLEACQAIARRHGLASSHVCFVQQTPEAIDAGVFHNDVISVGNQNVLLCHQRAFVDQEKQLAAISKQFQDISDQPLHVIEFQDSEINMEDTVSSYLFNSQLLTRRDGGMTLVCPIEAQENNSALACTERLLAEPNPVDQVEFLDLRQSMNNGGGPACLRLRVVLDETQQAAMHQRVIMSDRLYENLKQWINTHYREHIEPNDLRDPQLIVETSHAFESLASILDLPLDVF